MLTTSTSEELAEVRCCSRALGACCMVASVGATLPVLLGSCMHKQPRRPLLSCIRLATMLFASRQQLDGLPAFLVLTSHPLQRWLEEILFDGAPVDVKSPYEALLESDFW